VRPLELLGVLSNPNSESNLTDCLTLGGRAHVAGLSEIRGAVPSVKNFSLVGVPVGSAPPSPEDEEAPGESAIELVKQSSDEFL
jgi:hypothetical protein